MRARKSIPPGTRFGALVVCYDAVSRRRPDGAGSYYRVVCLCDCGNATVVDACNLRSGNTKSCSEHRWKEWAA